MNESLGDRRLARLDTILSRRAFGVGTAAALAVLTGVPESDAKKKKKKKKKKPSGTCIGLGEDCLGSGCCPSLECKPIFNSGPADTVCCRSAGTCRFAADCCRGTYCGGGECLTCKGEGEECSQGQCCPGFFCSILVPTEPGTCISSD